MFSAPLTDVITRIPTHLATLEGWNAELARSADPQQILSIVDHEEVRESPPAKNWHPNHRVTPPMLLLAEQDLAHIRKLLMELHWRGRIINRVYFLLNYIWTRLRGRQTNILYDMTLGT